MVYLLTLRMAAFLPVMLLHSMGAVINMEYFKFGPKENGLFLALVGLASAVCIVELFHDNNNSEKRWHAWPSG